MMERPLPHVELPNGVILPEAIARQLIWGGRETGMTWLEQLPGMLRSWCDRWEITLERAMPELSYNLVLFGTTPTHGPVVIKTSPPHVEVTAEIEALRATQGLGIVRLIDADPAVSIMLQQRAVPGTSLRASTEAGILSDREATTLAAQCMRRYWTPAPDNAHFLSLARWFQSLYDYQDTHLHVEGPIPRDIAEVAIRHAGSLLSLDEQHVILHGDLHHGNILLDRDDCWTVIDPKGLVGPRGYDIGTWMRNPPDLHSWPELPGVLSTRLDLFSELLGIDRYQLWQWSVVHSVLSECWTLEGAEIEGMEMNALRITHVLMQLPEGRR